MTPFTEPINHPSVSPIAPTSGLAPSPAFVPHPLARDRSLETRHSFGERLSALSLLVDALIIFGCLVFSYWLRFEVLTEIGVKPQLISFMHYLPYIVMADCSLLGAFAYYGAYDPSKLLQLRQVGITVVRAIVLWAVIFLSFTLIFKFQPPISRLFVMLSSGTVLFAVVGWRYVFHRSLQNGAAAARLRQRVLFVGWNETARALCESVTGGPHPSHAVVGYVRSGLENIAPSPTSVPDLGSLNDVSVLLQDHDIDVVILSSFDLNQNEIVSLANLCEREMRQFKVIPSFFPILVSGLRLESMSQVPVLGVTRLPLDHLHNRTLKRFVDILGASVGLTVFAPVMLLFMLLVRLESPGPVIYRQWRLGRNGRRFQILKIRSMQMGAERQSGPRWAKPNDPRRLRIGAVMRNWSIDELPQFWNVLKGDMSLIGPRPERPELIESFKYEVPHYNARHTIKPGMTGWAQVKGLRGDTDLAERITSDLFYMENWNLLLDLQILALTLIARKNAY